MAMECCWMSEECDGCGGFCTLSGYCWMSGCPSCQHGYFQRVSDRLTRLQLTRTPGDSRTVPELTVVFVSVSVFCVLVVCCSDRLSTVGNFCSVYHARVLVWFLLVNFCHECISSHWCGSRIAA